MRRANALVMNQWFFGLKRAFYATMIWTRGPLKDVDFTVPRYDLFKALERMGGSGLQRTLRSVLGVAASTLTEMLQLLDKRGWITRERCHEDRRYKFIRLTPAGKAAFVRACEQRFPVPPAPWGEEPANSPWVLYPETRDTEFFMLHVSVDEDEAVDHFARMGRKYGLAFGPYPPWNPGDLYAARFHAVTERLRAASRKESPRVLPSARVPPEPGALHAP